jgi:hypothetical protein
VSVFFQDKIIIVSVEIDDNGVVTETQSDEINARVEDYNKLIIDSKGQETLAAMIIFLDPEHVVNNEDKIIVVNKDGVTYPYSTKKWKIKKSPVIHGFNAHHRELYL